MDITFVVTGKAGKSGHEQWRKVNDEDFSTRIYSHSKREAFEASRLEIELREFKGDVFTYYTYLIVKNVAQVKSKEDEEKHERHGRTGSFFGMTIRIKGGYISDVSRLYNLFERVFEQRIKGRVLTDENTDGYLTFVIEKLSEGEDSFVLAEKDVLSAISAEDITVLPDYCATQQQKPGEVRAKLFNVGDTGHDSFLQALFNDAEVNVSRDYDTIEEIEIRRKQAEEQKKKSEEKKVISERPANNEHVSPNKRRAIRSSSCGITSEPSSSQSQTISVRSNTPASQCDNPRQTDDQYNRLLFKLISIVLETCKVLLTFIARQKSGTERGIKDNSELQEYENRLFQISKELDEVKKREELMDKASGGYSLTDGASFSLFNFKTIDYKLFIPVGIVLFIIIGILIGMHNSDDEPNNGLEEVVDSTIIEAVITKDTTNVITEDTLPSINTMISKYKVKSRANLRETPKNGKVVATLGSNAYFYVSKDTLEGEWVYGKTENEKSGYIHKDLLDLVE